MSLDKGEGENGEKKKRGCFFWALVVMVVAIAISYFFLRDDIERGVEVTRTVLAIRSLAKDEVPALRAEFPFDPAGPPTFDADLFRRYCTAREQMAQGFQPLVAQVAAMRGLPKIDASKPERALEQLGPLAEAARQAMQSVAPALRQARLSPEAFQWIATQTWGLAAEAAERNDWQGISAIEALRDTATEMGMFPQARGKEAGELAAILLDHLDARYELAGRSRAWQVVLAHLEAWRSAPPAAMLIDLGFAEHLQQILAELNKLAP